MFEKHDFDPPEAIRMHLKAGASGELQETLFRDDSIFERVTNVLLGDNKMALNAAREIVAEAGYSSLVLSSRLRDEAKGIAKPLVAIAEEAYANRTPAEPPAVLLAGGESTATITEDDG